MWTYSDVFYCLPAHTCEQNNFSFPVHTMWLVVCCESITACVGNIMIKISGQWFCNTDLWISITISIQLNQYTDLWISITNGKRTKINNETISIEQKSNKRVTSPKYMGLCCCKRAINYKLLTLQTLKKKMLRLIISYQCYLRNRCVRQSFKPSVQQILQAGSKEGSSPWSFMFCYADLSQPARSGHHPLLWH